MQQPFGRTGLVVGPVGFGAAPVGVLDRDVEETRRVLDTLLDHGVNLIDTSACYRGSEDLLGAALDGRRDRVVLVTKCGHAFDGARAAEWTPEIVHESVLRSLRRLRTDVLDVVLLHSCPTDLLQEGSLIDALVAERDAGRIRFAGYSGDNDAAAFAADHPQIAVVETSVNLVDQANLDGVVPKATGRGIGVIAKRPLANAAWKRLEEQPGMYGTYARPYAERLAATGLDPAALGFDGRPEEVWPEIALRFVLSWPGVHTAIVGTTNPANARSNLAAAEKGPLPAEVLDRIRDAFRRGAADSDDGWPGLT